MLDGAPAEEETQKRLQEDEVKTKLLEQVILRSASKTPCVSDQNTQSRILSYLQLHRSNMCDGCYGENVGVHTLARAVPFFFSSDAKAKPKAAERIKKHPLNPRATALLIVEQNSYVALDDIRDRGGCFEMQPRSAAANSGR